MTKIALDAGHGFNTPGKRSPDGEREWSFNNKVLKACEARLRQYSGVQILRTDDPTGQTDVSLAERVRRANSWGANVFASLHHNAFTGEWHSGGGTEVYVSTGASAKSVSLANATAPKIAQAMGLNNRGVKRADFYVIRYTNMPAILVEGGFMDSTVDIKALRSDARLKAQGEAVADAIAQTFGLKFSGQSKPPAPSNGSLVDYLNSKGQDSSFAARKRLAEQYGIKNYTGTAEQNTLLLNMLQAGKKPTPSKKIKTNSLVDYLKLTKQPSDFASRKKLAEKHGIRKYKGTAAQNKKLLDILNK